MLEKIESELIRLGVLHLGGERELTLEAHADGRVTISCDTAMLFTPPEEIVRKLSALADQAGFDAVWTALFDFPEGPDLDD